MVEALYQDAQKISLKTWADYKIAAKPLSDHADTHVHAPVTISSWVQIRADDNRN